MPLNLISNFLVTLFLTLIIELIIAFLFGYKDKISIIVIILINVITNPIINYLIQLNYNFKFFGNNLILMSFLEIVVILVEWRMLIYAFNSKEYRKLFLLSLVMNLSSFIIGIILFGYN